MEHAPMLLLMFYSLFCMLMASHSTSLDTITPFRPLRENETIVSAGGTFELGFFTDDYNSMYLGIWYKNQTEANTKTVVWVANREEPIYTSETNSSVLRLTDQGILVLLGPDGNTTTTTIWSSNYSSRSTKNPAVARLLESGNLVIKDANADDTNTHNFLWQSFDYPWDTLLPGMKLGKNKKTGLDRYLSSSSGRFRYQLDPRGYAQLFIMIDEQVRYLRVGPRDGLGINWKRSVYREFLTDYNCESRFVYDDEKRMSFSYGFFNCSDLTRIVLNGDGILENWVWKGYNWIPYSTAPMDGCDTYASCGAYSICYLDTSSVSYYNTLATKKCRCLEGFVPKLVQDSGDSDWDWSEGCVRRRPLLDCNSKLVGGGDVFVKYSGLNLPDSHYLWFNKSMKLEECDTLCLKNCSCMAYANLDLSGSGSGGGSGCLLVFGDLLDIRNSSTLSDQHFFIRMAASKPDKTSLRPNKRKTIEVSLLAASTGAIVSLGLLGMCFYISKKWQRKTQERKEHHQQNEDVQLQLFDLATIAIATNNFSIDNKLGEGGFGPVYKGMLRDGQEIAVKRLSKTSRQGVGEFKNEVICIAKLQHRNLVQLLGCCIQGEEKMLIYEYMSNNSLDSFIFDQSRSMSLDWPKSFHIINGVARGLLYLHQDSTLRVVHRDLKASNVLLDHDMNPKISDFGMARIFGENESKANTKRVVGTYGYISPEYAIEGLFSVKSDVFSFGVLVLEIVSGKRNRELYDRDHHLNLLGHAWRLHREGRSMELMNASIENSCNQSQVLRSIHVSLLCVQQRPEDRPYMSNVVLMLTRDGTLPQPKQPGFFFARNLLEANRLSCNGEPSSANEVTITELEARY